MTYLPDLTNEIKNLRKKANLTQKQLAKIVGVNQSLISQIELGTKNPSYKLADKILSTINSKLSNEVIIKDVITKNLIFVTPNDTVNEVLNKIGNKFDQLPVIESGKNVGTVFSKDLIKLFDKKNFRQIKVKDIMGIELPVINESESIYRIQKLLQLFDAVLVKKNNCFGIITRSDLIKKMKN